MFIQYLSLCLYNILDITILNYNMFIQYLSFRVVEKYSMKIYNI